MFVVDRWGKVRGKFDWQVAAEEVAMLKLIRELESETRPVRPVDNKQVAGATDEERDDDDTEEGEDDQ